MCTGAHGFIPAENVAKVVIEYTTQGGIAENVIYFRFPSAPSGADIVALATDVSTYWQAFVLDTQSTDITLTKITVTDQTVAGGYQHVRAESETGTVVSPVMPNNVTLAIAFRSNLSGRSNRGRLFVIGLTESQVLYDTVPTSPLNTLLAAYSGFFDAIIVNTDWEHVIVSYCGGGSWRSDALVTSVVSYTAEGTIDTMRRRLKGRGV